MAFQLSAELVGHEQDVRAVSFPGKATIVTTSRDNTVRLWRSTSETTPSYESSIIVHGSESINSLAYLSPSAEYPEGLVITGARDAIIDVRSPSSTPGQDALRLLVGHANNVCALDIAPKASYFVSGGWDGQARVWNIGKWETEVVLEGHGYGGANDHKVVWGVLAFDEHTVITGCADHMIRIFDLRLASAGAVHPTITIRTADIVRDLCRLPTGHPSGADMASAGNDGIIRLWKLAGQQADELRGHESFIYSLVCLPSGELVSSGEDRTVRVWKGRQCIQTITHPAISVWSVAVCSSTGDIVSGASDHVARVFTRSPDRVASPSLLRRFNESVESSAIPLQQLGNIHKESLPGPEFLSTKSGKKEGQTIMIRDDDGSVSAHQWSTSEQQWIKVGTVVNSAGSSGRKVEFQGQSYDFVFDVDIEDGKPPLKLPYNLSENPYDRATRFLGDNDLPMTYLDSVANFIVENTQGAHIGHDSHESISGIGGTRNLGRSGESSPSPMSACLPNKEYVTLLQARFTPLEKKLLAVNADLLDSGRKDFALNPQDIQTLSDLVKSLATAVDKIPALVPATTASAPLPTPRVPSHSLELVLRLVKNWEYANRLPALDLLRCMCVSADVADYDDSRGGSLLDMVISNVTSGCHVADVKAIENSIMMVFRVVTNLFVSAAGRKAAAADVDKVVRLMECVMGTSDDAVGDLSGPLGADNRNVLVAMTSAAINYGVLAHTEHKALGSHSVGDVALILLINVLGKVLATQTDSEVVYRAMVALGILISMPGEGEYAQTVRALEAEAWIRTAQSRATEERIQSLAGVLLKLLS